MECAVFIGAAGVMPRGCSDTCSMLFFSLALLACIHGMDALQELKIIVNFQFVDWIAFYRLDFFFLPRNITSELPFFRIIDIFVFDWIFPDVMYACIIGRSIIHAGIPIVVPDFILAENVEMFFDPQSAKAMKVIDESCQ